MSGAIVLPERGKFYLLKGGLVLRCHGPYRCAQHKDPALQINTYAQPSRELGDGPTAAYSSYNEDVIRELTTADAEWLRGRRESLLSKTPPMKTEADEIMFVEHALGTEVDAVR